MTFQQMKPLQLATAAPLGEASVVDARRMLDEARAALDCDLVAARQCVERLANLLQTTARTSGGNGSALIRGGLAPWRMRLVRDHIAANLMQPLSVPQLAALVRLSRAHFTRAFGASFGMTPHAFIIGERVERAKRLLLGSDAPICDIALSCGFTDQPHLTRLFTRREGLSPAVWRRLNLDTPIRTQAA